jgi:hypothetical protein
VVSFLLKGTAMTKQNLLALLAAGGLAAIISCDAASPDTVGGLDVGDCPYGTFKPVGLDECVFPANTIFNEQIGVADNRCTQGQPAVPPSCVSDSGARAYLTISMKCAPGYRYLPGACRRDVSGVGGFGGFFTGAAGTFATGGDLGTAGGGDAGAGGGFGPAGDFGTGLAGCGGDGVGGCGGGAGF